MKVCKTCKTEKEVVEYHKDSTTKDGLRTQCKPCRKAERKPQSEAAKERMRNRNLNAFYGITPETYEAMLVAQNYACAICGQHQSEFTRALAVDHNHVTGEVRGLLCRGCNTGIGNLGDDANRVLDAATYLLSYENALVSI